MKACYRGTTVLNESPMVAVMDNVLDTSECQEFIELARNSMDRAKVSLDAEAAVVDGRTGSNTWLSYDRFEAASCFGQRISELIDIPLERAEAIQVIHYGPSEKYGAHFDAYDLATEKGRRCCKWGGQRLVTCLVYLNDVAEGGGTSFPKLDVQVDARAGRMVIFHNVDEEDYSRPHPASLHGGDPVLEGEKWAMNIWFHQASTRVPFDFEETATSAPARAWYSNRAVSLFEAAFEQIESGKPATAPVFCYWDTWFGPEPEELGQPDVAVTRLVDRKLSNRLADKRRLPAMLRESGLERLAPASFDSPRAALEARPKDALFFVKTVTGTAGQGVRCVDRTELETARLERGEIVQQAVTALRTYEGRKFTVRAYVIIIRGEVRAWPQGILIAHGVPYDPVSSDYAVQVDHSGYAEPGSAITMLSTAELEWGGKFATSFDEFTSALAPILEDLRVASTKGAFSILGLDLLVTDEGQLRLIEINAHPNFVHTGSINRKVNIPMLRHVMVTAWGV